MKQEKSTLEAILNTIGYILGAVIVWFIIGAAWNGIHDWFCRNILGKTPGEHSGEMFGKMAFYSWVMSLVVVVVTVANVDEELGSKIMLQYMRFNFFFVMITLFGLIYFFRSLKR